MDWTELIVTVATKEADTAAAVATLIADGGLYIEDYTDLQEQVKAIARVDLIEQELLDKPKDIVKIHLYVSPEDNVREVTDTLEQRLLGAGVTPLIETQSLCEEDWENAWKQHYHPLEIGKRLAVAPSWEPYQGQGRTVVKLDPGMAFGTGTHETTALCLELLDEHVRGGEVLLDVGCGSGILGVASVLLGASSALGIDIDPLAVRTAGENAALNGVEKAFTAVAGDLSARAVGRYDIITANIVADAIIRLAPDIPPLLAEGGLFFASGIIVEREPEVLAALEAAGMQLVDRRQKRGWLALACRVQGAS